MTAPAIKFGPFNVTTQVFYQTALSYALVNIKPLTKGHVLVCPRRVVPRVSQLTSEEATDFYTSVHKVSKMVEEYFKADALNISIQDGPLAGQSVAHVHCHIIPRRLNDLANVDDIYRLLDGKEGDLEHYFQVVKHNRGKQSLGADNDERKPRSMEDMEDEASRLRESMKSFE